MANWGNNDPIVSTIGREGFQQAPGLPAWGRGDIPVTQEAESLIRRSGKQLYNILPEIATGILKTALRVPGAREEIQQMIEARKKLGVPIKGKPIVAPYNIPPPENWKESGVDIVTGISKFIIQLRALQVAMPASTPTPVVWEMQNLMTGGTPGLGAAFGATMGAAGKLGKTQLEKATAEGVALYVANRISGAEPAEAATMAAVPGVLRGGGALLQRARGIKGFERRPTRVTGTKILSFDQLPQSAQDALVDGIGHKQTRWILETQSTSDIYAKNKKIIDTPSKYKGKATGPILVDNTGKLIDGAHRLRNAISDKQSTIKVYQEVSAGDTGAKITAAPEQGLLALKPPTLTAYEGAVQTATNQLKAIRRTEIPKLKRLYRAERGRRAGIFNKMYRQARVDGMSIEEASHQVNFMRGRLIQGDKINALLTLSDEHWSQLFGRTETLIKEGRQYDFKNATEALRQLKNNTFVPQRYKIDLLRELFGDEFAKPLYQMMSVPEKAIKALIDIGALLKSLQAGGEASAIGRQLPPSGFVRAKIYGKAAYQAIRSYVQPSYAKKIEASVLEHPKYESAVTYGRIQFTKAGRLGAEEYIPSLLPQKIPVLGRMYKRGEAAFTSPQNRARIELWDILTDKAIQDKTLTANFLNNPTSADVKAMSQLGGWINDLMGRSSLGRSRALQNLGQFLNLVGYAPRFAMSRLKLVGTLGGLLRGTTNKTLLKESAKALVKFAAVESTIATAAYLSNPEDNKYIFHSLSADFLKIKEGNARFDPTFGIGRVISLFSQMLMGERLTAAGRYTKEKRTEILRRFIRSKESPLLNLIATLYTGQNFVGQPVSKLAAIREVTTMLFLNDAYDAYKNDGLGTAIAAFGLGFVGVGVMSYPETTWTQEAKFEDTEAQKAYGKNWDDLSASQQAKLRRDNRPQFEQFELQEKQERQLRPPPEINLEEQRKAGNWIRKQQSKEHQEILRAAGTSTDVSRTIGDWYLNDERYKLYRSLIAKYLAEELTKMESRRSWIFRRSNAAVDRAMDAAQRDARRDVKRSAR